MLIIKGGLICCSNTAFMTHGYQNCHLVKSPLENQTYTHVRAHTRICYHKKFIYYKKERRPKRVLRKVDAHSMWRNILSL